MHVGVTRSLLLQGGSAPKALGELGAGEAELVAAWREKGAIPWGGAGVQVGPVGGRLVTVGESGCEPGVPGWASLAHLPQGDKRGQGSGMDGEAGISSSCPCCSHHNSRSHQVLFCFPPNLSHHRETKRRSGRSHSSLSWSSARLGFLYHPPTLLRAALVSPSFLVHILLILPDALMLCSSQSHSGFPILPPSLASETLLLPFPHQDFSSPLPTPQPWA